jgi:DNA-binding XRE family transcriptional regulator
VNVSSDVGSSFLRQSGWVGLCGQLRLGTNLARSHTPGSCLIFDTIGTMSPDTGKRVAERRREVGFTQEGLAEAVSCGRATIARIEAGHLPNLKLAFAIARKLRTKVDDLFALEPPPLAKVVRASELESPARRKR